MARATGEFEVRLTPQAADDRPGAAFLGRLAIDKTFSGPLAATSVGQMLAAMGNAEGSAGYVALERVTGALEGKVGSFMLQHSGHSNRGTQSLTVNVVADSGTDELAGLSGTMTIVNDNGRHSYAFDYALPG